MKSAKNRFLEVPIIDSASVPKINLMSEIKAASKASP